jgi:hypothetical protein
MFTGMESWRHFRGDPASGGSRELYHAGHDALVAWCQPPGRALSPADAAIVCQALADAETARRERAGACCYDCASTPTGACDDHLDDLDLADAYRDLAAELATALPQPPEGALMTGPEHYRMAERLLENIAASKAPSADYYTETLAEAQVHATLALAAATGISWPSLAEGAAWQAAAGTARQSSEHEDWYWLQRERDSRAAPPEDEAGDT